MSLSVQIYNKREHHGAPLHLINTAANEICENVPQETVTLSNQNFNTYMHTTSNDRNLVFQQKMLRVVSLSLGLSTPISLVSYYNELITYNLMVVQLVTTVIFSTLYAISRVMSHTLVKPERYTVSKIEASHVLCKLLKKAEESLENQGHENPEWPTCSISCSNITLFPVSVLCKGNPEKMRHHFAADHLLAYFQSSKKLSCPQCRQPILQVEMEEKVQQEVLSAFVHTLSSVEFQKEAVKILDIRKRCIGLVSHALANALVSQIKVDSDRYMEGIRTALHQHESHATIVLVEE